MTVDDCAEISHAVSAVLDVHDPIAGAYTLEVSSPGLDRPLVRPEHFERFRGERARLETTMLFDGRRRFVGLLGGVDHDHVLITPEEGGDGGPVRLPIGGLRKAKLVPPTAVPSVPQRARGGKRKGRENHGA